jgi:hypothetical protein
MPRKMIQAIDSVKRREADRAGSWQLSIRYKTCSANTGTWAEDLELESRPLTERKGVEPMHCWMLRRRHEELWSVLALLSTRPENYADFAN